MKAVVLAAGEGVRLQPLTSTRPKHLIKIAGKPILEHCLNALKTSGITEVVIVVHYMADAIREYFEDGKKIGLKIEYVQQNAILGTGNAVATVEPYVGGEFLLVYGDLLFGANAVKNVIEANAREKPIMTMSVVPVERPESYGIVELDSENYVTRIVEKPNSGEAPSNLANAGIYVFSPEIFQKIKETSASSRGEWEVTDAISLLLKEQKKLLAAKLLREEWLDIGRPWDLLEANRWVLTRMNHRTNGIVENGAHLVGPATVAKTARLRSGAYLEGPVFIDEGSDIGPNCYIRPYTSIGRRARIGNACEIKNCIVMDDTHIGHLSYVGDSVVGEKCNLAAGTMTANYRLDAKTVKMIVKDKVVDTERRKLGAIIGDNVKSGINALFMPGVKVGNNSWVGPNVVVHRDLQANMVLLLKQEVEKKELEP